MTTASIVAFAVHIGLKSPPLGLLLLALFVLLSASGALLAPLLGQAAGTFDYLHEFAHALVARQDVG